MATTVKTTPAAGESLLHGLLDDGVAIAHECGGKLACTTCRVVVLSGADALSAASEDELDMLERAPDGQDESNGTARLACQALSSGGAVTVLVPQAALPAREPGAGGLSITPRAARHLAAQLARHAGAVAVRLRVEPSGCSGFGYRVEPVDVLRNGDAVFDAGGVRVAVDALSLPYLAGTRVDLVSEGLARRLRFDNPNVRGECGCGESFNV